MGAKTSPLYLRNVEKYCLNWWVEILDDTCLQYSTSTVQTPWRDESVLPSGYSSSWRRWYSFLETVRMDWNATYGTWDVVRHGLTLLGCTWQPCAPVCLSATSHWIPSLECPSRRQCALSSNINCNRTLHRRQLVFLASEVTCPHFHRTFLGYHWKDIFDPLTPLQKSSWALKGCSGFIDRYTFPTLLTFCRVYAETNCNHYRAKGAVWY